MVEFGLQAIFGMAGSVLHFVSVGLTIMLAFYLIKRFPSAASNYVGLGAFLISVSFVLFYFFQYFLNIWISVDNITFFYTANGIIGSLGQILFLIGLYTFFQQLYRQSEELEKP